MSAPARNLVVETVSDFFTEHKYETFATIKDYILFIFIHRHQQWQHGRVRGVLSSVFCFENSITPLVEFIFEHVENTRQPLTWQQAMATFARIGWSKCLASSKAISSLAPAIAACRGVIPWLLTWSRPGATGTPYLVETNSHAKTTSACECHMNYLIVFMNLYTSISYTHIYV